MESYATEEQFQAACMIWYFNTYKDAQQMCFAVDNNPSPRLPKNLRVIEGNRKRSIGVRRGVLDTVFVGFLFVSFIDFKLPGNDYTDEQKEFVKKVLERGFKCYKVYPPLQNFKDLIHTLKKGGQ